MKQFFKFMLASMLGTFILMVVLFFIMLGVFASIAALASRDAPAVKANSVLHLNLNAPIQDREVADPFDSFNPFTGSFRTSIGLNELISNIRKAKNDPNIEGILIDPTGMAAGMATLDEVRQALQDFKQSGKFIISYAETFSQGGYYLSTVSDNIYLHPEGIIDFRGLNAQMVFFKNMLDKLGIQAQVIRHGEFKSAGEPFFLERMSPENREQIQSFTGTIWNNLLGDIASSRNLSINHLNEVADGFRTRTAAMAYEWKMVDELMFQDQLTDELRLRLGLEPDQDVNLVSYRRYTRSASTTGRRQVTGRPKIAVVYGEGPIISGRGTEGNIGSDRIAEAIPPGQNG
jgi:protease IV